MKKAYTFVRKYPLSILCLLLVWYLSIWFMPPEWPELEDVAFIDKWTHFVMYGGTCSVIWWEYLQHHGKPKAPGSSETPKRINKRKLFLLGWLAPILMSGCIELVQEYLTENRAGEWLDLAANATGCTIGAIIGMTYWHYRKPSVRP